MTASYARKKVEMLFAHLKRIIGLDRLRSRFDAKMTGTPDESAFKVVTRAVNRNSNSFRNLAREIASIDTLEAFLIEFKETFKEPAVEADASPHR